MATLSWATKSHPRFSGEAFAPGCPALLVSDEVFFRKLFRHVNKGFRSGEFLYSPFVGIRYSHARNLDSELIGIPYSHGPEFAQGSGSLRRRDAWREDPWERIEGWLPGREGSVGVTARDHRLFVGRDSLAGFTGALWWLEGGPYPVQPVGGRPGCGRERSSPWRARRTTNRP